MKALVVSQNLCGDSLYIQPAVKKWQAEHPDWQLDLLTHKNYIAVLYCGMGIDWHYVFFDDCDATDASQYDSKFLLGAGDAGKLAEQRKCHIAEAYAEMMGVKLDEPIIETPFGKFRAIRPHFDPIEARSGTSLEVLTRAMERQRLHNDCVLWSPFSASCTSQEKDRDGRLLGKPPNKMLTTKSWMDAIRYMRSLGPLRLLGGLDEEVPATWQLTLEEMETLGLPLAETALLMRQSRLVVTVDNGMGHLAASQDANCVVFYPMVLSLGFIFPWGCPYSVPIHMRPQDITSASALYYVERSVKWLDKQRGLRSRASSGQSST